MFLFYISLIVFGAFLLYALFGTGQRAPLVYVIATIAMGLNVLYKVRLKWIAVLGTALIILFAIISINSGRVDTNNTLHPITSIFIRIFYIDQYESMLGFRYIYELEYSWFYDWFQGILGILPGHSGSSLDHDLYNNLHGTSRGTSSLSVPASTYYNGSLASVIVIFFALGVLYSYLYYKMISGRRTIVRSLGYGGLILICSVFVMGAPATLLNKGFLAFVLVLVIRKLRLHKLSQSPWH
jgi:oligosaccharide repeat unit polymerase